VNSQIKKGLLLRMSVKNMLKSVNIWQSYKVRLLLDLCPPTVGILFVHLVPSL